MGNTEAVKQLLKISIVEGELMTACGKLRLARINEVYWEDRVNLLQGQLPDVNDRLKVACDRLKEGKERVIHYQGHIKSLQSQLKALKDSSG